MPWWITVPGLLALVLVAGFAVLAVRMRQGCAEISAAFARERAAAERVKEVSR
jgi:hypothetical protein